MEPGWEYDPGQGISWSQCGQGSRCSGDQKLFNGYIHRNILEDKDKDAVNMNLLVKNSA